MAKMRSAMVVVLGAASLSAVPGCGSPTHVERVADSATARLTENEALLAALLDLKDRDQEARAAMIEVMRSVEPIPGGGFRISDEQHGIMRAVGEIDAESTAFLKAMIAERGWPKISEIGAEGAGAAWLLAQHADADPDFQGRVLELMEPLVEAGEAKGAHFALLTDRVRLANGEPQVFATQFETGEDGVMRPQSTVDWANVEARRAEVGLPTLEVYGQSMIETYGGEVELIPADIASGDEG